MMCILYRHNIHYKICEYLTTGWKKTSQDFPLLEFVLIKFKYFWYHKQILYQFCNFLNLRIVVWRRGNLPNLHPQSIMYPGAILLEPIWCHTSGTLSFSLCILIFKALLHNWCEQIVHSFIGYYHAFCFV